MTSFCLQNVILPLLKIKSQNRKTREQLAGMIWLLCYCVGPAKSLNYLMTGMNNIVSRRGISEHLSY